MMMIETTIYVNNKIKQKLDKAADMSLKSRSTIIVLLMKRLVAEHSCLLQNSRCVQYQESLPETCWTRFHICIHPREYEYFLDMRKFCKSSVSLLIAHAVDYYLDEIIDEIINRKLLTDNYHFQHYILIKEIVNNIICWKIYWGMPENHENLFPEIICSH